MMVGWYSYEPYKLCFNSAKFEVHPHPVYFQNEAKQNVSYFNGSTIRLECDATCKRDCDIRIRYNRSVYLVPHNLYKAPIRFELLNSKDSEGKKILTIINSDISYSGSYQCEIKVWNGFIVGKEIHVQITGKLNELLSMYTCIRSS